MIQRTHPGIGITPCRPLRARSLATRRSGSGAQQAVCKVNSGGPELTRIEKVRAVLKPGLYAVAWVPVLVGFSAGYAATGQPKVGRGMGNALASCMVIFWLNLTNDAWDAETGADEAKWESAVGLLGSARRVHALAWPCLAMAVAIFSMVIREAASAKLLACAVACGHAYQAPPLRLSYYGLGEPLCFAAFGPLATTAFFLASQGPERVSWEVVFPSSLLVGLTTAVILFCSHLHQVDEDAKVNKLSPVVRLGLPRASFCLSLSLVAAHVLPLGLACLDALPLPAALAPLAAAPRARALSGFVRSNLHEPLRLRRSKFVAVSWHGLYGASLAAGFVLSRLCLDAL